LVTFFSKKVTFLLWIFKMQINESLLRELAASVGNRHGLWKKILRKAEVKTMLEIGVFRGEFAGKILSNCEDIDLYYMIDPWAELPDWNKPANSNAKSFDDVFQEAMDATAFAADKRRVLRGRTKDVIHQIPDQSLDFAYVDGDHTLRGMTIDLIRLLPKMKPGGIIGGDDFTPRPWHHGTEFEPTLVFPFSIYFAEAHNLPIFALPFNQCVIQNDPGTGFSFTDIAGVYGDLSLKNPEALGPRKPRSVKPGKLAGQPHDA
jgi:hypothetical protein